MLAIDGEHPVGHPKDKCWQLQKISCVTFVRSSIVNDVIQTISSKIFFFLTKKVWAYIKYQNDFQRVRSFCVRKKLLPLFFLFRWFIFVCDMFLYAQNFFVICMHLFLFVIICENLFFLWESIWMFDHQWKSFRISSYLWSFLRIYFCNSFEKISKCMNPII